MKANNKKTVNRDKRKLRIRKKISGSIERPRVSVFKSSKHLNAQLINDNGGNTLLSINSFGQVGRCVVAECHKLGKQFGEKCLSIKVSKIVFDKNGYAYHGRIKAFADGVREAGIDF